MYYGKEKHPVKIIEDSIVFAIHPVEMTIFMEEVERKFGELKPGYWLEVSAVCGLTIDLARMETLEEFEARQTKNAAEEVRYKKQKKSSWERQKRKFSAARKT